MRSRIGVIGRGNVGSAPAPAGGIGCKLVH